MGFLYPILKACPWVTHSEDEGSSAYGLNGYYGQIDWDAISLKTALTEFDVNGMNVKTTKELEFLIFSIQSNLHALERKLASQQKENYLNSKARDGFHIGKKDLMNKLAFARHEIELRKKGKSLFLSEMHLFKKAQDLMDQPEALKQFLHENFEKLDPYFKDERPFDPRLFYHRIVLRVANHDIDGVAELYQNFPEFFGKLDLPLPSYQMVSVTSNNDPNFTLSFPTSLGFISHKSENGDRVFIRKGLLDRLSADYPQHNFYAKFPLNESFKIVENEVHPGDDFENGDMASLPIDLSLINEVKKGKISKVKSLLASGKDIDGTDLNGDTPLIWAVRRKRLNTLKYLVENQAKLFKMNSDGETPLRIAINEVNSSPGEIERKIAEYLFEKDSNPKQARTIEINSKEKD
jgi:hypothetical protein